MVSPTTPVAPMVEWNKDINPWNCNKMRKCVRSPRLPPSRARPPQVHATCSARGGRRQAVCIAPIEVVNFARGRPQSQGIRATLLRGEARQASRGNLAARSHLAHLGKHTL